MQDGPPNVEDEALRLSSERLNLPSRAQSLCFEPPEEHFRPLIVQVEQENFDVLWPISRGRTGR